VKRRKLAAAGALAVTVFAATVALGANFGLFGLAQPDTPVGHLSGSQRPPATAVGTVAGNAHAPRHADD
jgi:hypothetical protein